MWLLDHTCATPAQNLALDEALLDEAEAGRLGEGLRFWESPVLFAVLGLSQTVAEHVNREACTADGVPILRRCSAGGCVLQGPGCLNFSLILCTDRLGCQTITASYDTILSSVAGVLTGLGRPAIPTGISDLAIEGRKVSGNAQRRRNRYFLHHGTLLLNFDLRACTTYLREPSDQPMYRNYRKHESFIVNLDIERSAITTRVSKVFGAKEQVFFSGILEEATGKLVSQKYALSTWNFRR